MSFIFDKFFNYFTSTYTMSIKTFTLATGRTRTQAALAKMQTAAPDVAKWSDEVLAKLKSRKGKIVSAEISGETSFAVVVDNLNLSGDDFKLWTKMGLLVNVSKDRKGALLLFSNY